MVFWCYIFKYVCFFVFLFEVGFVIFIKCVGGVECIGGIDLYNVILKMWCDIEGVIGGFGLYIGG